MAKKPLKFITGNKNKLREVQEILSPIKIQPVNLDLTEIQEVDAKVVIKHKLLEALKYKNGPLIVDDSSLSFSCFKYKLPGPLVKWFNEYIGMHGLATLVKKMRNNKARATTIVGYAKNPKQILFFEGTLEGTIVYPKGRYGFGYDQIFLPTGKSKTLAELKKNPEHFYSPRALALNKLKKYLENEKR